MAERGIGFLGWNTRYRGNEAFFLLEHALVDIGAGVRWLREEGGADVVVVARQLRAVARSWGRTSPRPPTRTSRPPSG